MVTVPLPSPCLACGDVVGVKNAAGWRCASCGWRVGDVPDADLAPVRVDVVYDLRFQDRIKIGTSSRPRSRLAQLRFEELLAFERGDRRLEHDRHVQFADHRYPGSEWFTTHEALERHIRAVVKDLGPPWTAYGRWMSEELAHHVS
jgi:hypothetical protein